MYQTIFFLILIFLAQPATALEIIEDPQPVAENNFAVLQAQKKSHSADFELMNMTAQSETSSVENVAVNARDDKGNTPLYYALTQNEDLAAAQHLLANGADVNAPTADGLTAIGSSANQPYFSHAGAANSSLYRGAKKAHYGYVGNADRKWCRC